MSTSADAGATGAALARRGSAISRRTLLKGFVAGTVGAVTGMGVYGVYERDALGLTSVDVPVTGLPPGLAGLRIGFMTDVHRSRWVSAEDVHAAVTLLMSASPDLIVLGGDYVTYGDPAFVGPVAEALSALSAPHGVFGILGNHDSDPHTANALSSKHVQMLKDARTTLTIHGESLVLAGLRFWTRHLSDVASVIRGATGTVVLLAHDPRRLTEAATLKVPLLLSGHTHGGQVVLPVAGAIAARRFPIVAGLGRKVESTIFVSRGIGTVYVPMRINCPPEVALLTLTPA
jgi:hypothetical protein